MTQSCRVVIRTFIAAIIIVGLPLGIRAGTTGTLGGWVFTRGGAPLKDAKVSATSPSQSEITTTDVTGHFVFVSLIPDTYTVTASKDGYQSSSQPGLLVSADNTQQVEFDLDPVVKTLAKIKVSQNTTGLLRPGTTQSMYTVTPPIQRTLSVLNGGTSLDQAYSAISAVPGAFVPPGQTGWNQPIFLRGGDFNEVGYELDGIPLNRAFDNLPTTSLSTNGQQQLQVYTGGAPADAESHGLAGYVNQVIKTGTVPGFADASLALGSPTLYNKASIEGGGATADRRFTYYFGVLGYNQDFRYIDQFNGALFSQTFGQPFDLANAVFGPLSSLPGPGVGCPILGGAGSNYAGCYANHGYFNSLPVGPGGYIQGPYPLGGQQPQQFNSTVADRETALNFHYSIPHERIDINDDIQVLYDVSQLYTNWYSSYNDWGGAGTWTAAESATPGLHPPGSVPAFQSGFQYTGALGQPVAGIPGGPISGMIPYLFPSEDQYGVNGQIPVNQRDASSNAQALVKAQYQHNFSSGTFARVYFYSAYSNYFVHSPNAANQFYDVTSLDRELFTHTYGAAATYASQITPVQLLSMTASYMTSNDGNTDNEQMTNSQQGAPFFPPQQSAFAALVSASNPMNGVCYYFDPVTFSAPTPTSCQPTTPVPGPPLAPVTNTKFLTYGGPFFPAPPGFEWLSVENGPSGVVNKVTPKFTAFSIDDQWRPANRVHVNAGIRLDNFTYDLSSTSGGPMTQYWFNAWNLVMCANSGVNGGVPIDETTPSSFGGPGLPPGTPCGLLGPGWHNATISNSTPTSFSHTVFQPRLGATYEADVDDVLRLSAGSYAQPAPAQYEEYNTLQQNLANYIGGLYYSLGYTTPAHDLNPSISYNYDFSWEHRFHRTDSSFKLTPFYRNTSDKVQQFFINPSTGTVSGVNAGKQTAYGVEFLLASGDPERDGWSALFSYTYTYSHIQYGSLPNGSTLLSGVNSSIQLYNSFTSACKGAAPSTDPTALCGVYGGSNAVATEAPVAPGLPGVANPYYNAPARGLVDPNGSYPSYDVVPSGTQLSSASYGVPNNMNLAVTYHHDKLAVTPLFSYISGSRYGAPEQQIGVDPRSCAPLAGAVASDPRYKYGGVGVPYDATTCFNTMVIPDQFTGNFDSPGAFVEPSFFTINAQLSYDLTSRATARVTFANILQSCFGGSAEPWTGGKPQCGYDVLPGHIPPVGNIYNPGDSIQRLVQYPYGNILTATPFNMYFTLDFKL